MHQRLVNLRALLHEHTLDGLLVTAPANRRYLSGFTGSSGALLISADAAWIITDFRYRQRAQQEAPLFRLREISTEMPYLKTLATLIDELGIRTVGFEAQHLTVAAHTRYSEYFAEELKDSAPQLQATTDLIETLRTSKDSDELAILCQAVRLTDAALARVLPHLRPEMTERQAAWLLEVAMREAGAEGVAFPVVVAAGLNAALAHAVAGDAPLGIGQPIIIDMGAKLHGYHADLTRTLVFGAADETFWNVYNAVLNAQQAALAGIQPGMAATDADALARNVIEAAGYGEQFGHGLGHGVGLDIHEAPHIGRSSEDTVQTGSVFTVEPGIYIEGWGGVRIEDLVYLHADGIETLSAAPEAPVILI
ncbi:MAG: M24 family metallopeptidase [Chloroflexaceae bacterium]|nr:M24 family metallopeptidase [Chloroflexaceae bacterium]